MANYEYRRRRSAEKNIRRTRSMLDLGLSSTSRGISKCGYRQATRVDEASISFRQ